MSQSEREVLASGTWGRIRESSVAEGGGERAEPRLAAAGPAECPGWYKLMVRRSRELWGPCLGARKGASEAEMHPEPGLRGFNYLNEQALNQRPGFEN